MREHSENIAATTPPKELGADFYQNLNPRLERFAYARLRDSELALDVVQDTWLSVLRHRDQHEGRAALETWVFAILKRKIIDVQRRSKPQISFDEELMPDEQNPRERLDDRAAVAFARDRIEQLPEREREAMRLVDLAGFARDEAAAKMGVTLGALRVTLHRGRQRVRDAMLAAEFAI